MSYFLVYKNVPVSLQLPSEKNILCYQFTVVMFSIFSIICTFGFKKWKGHVTQRPLHNRSETVQNLYADVNKIKLEQDLLVFVILSIVFGYTDIVTPPIFGVDRETTLYNRHIKPLVYAICLMLPVAYIIGLIFTLKTHTSSLTVDFTAEQLKRDNVNHQGMVI
ncbi:unnamed protein product [Mytilus edulis]|uniref:Uncharacterized protein n=1 Tax=Mytilus edulis TaxID=6550 RepID=A0A8S3UG38_MYTED|nr:unnamed protein product [Mytilus edulis]